MNEFYLLLLALLPVVSLIVYITINWAGRFGPSYRSNLLNLLSLVGISAAGSAFVMNELHTLDTQFDLMFVKDLGLSIKIDGLSSIMLLMVSLLAFVVMRFSQNYMEGDPRKDVFLRRIALTVASVELLVLSGNILHLFIFWVMTSVCLHFLLKFYPRPKAIIAAKKKFIVARIGDLSLLSALLLLYYQFNTADLNILFEKAYQVSSLNGTVTVACILIVLAALLKSAQFPTHGWLVEVTESPTPVSALLHAGLLNAGPFLIVRLAPVVYGSVEASLLLIALGGFTALFASSVFLTQSSVKVSLAYSSVAHMGFMLLICGFGLYSAAILHLVAHSFYKAHAFLSSGSAIDSLRARRLRLPERKGNLLLILMSVLTAITIYLAMCYAWGIHPEDNFTLMAAGAIIVMGITLIISPTFDSKSSLMVMLQSVGMAFAVTLAFFTLEHVAHQLLHRQLPQEFSTHVMVKIAVVTVLVFFSLAIVLQLLAPRLKSRPWMQAFGVHLKNGFYANALFDRLVGGQLYEHEPTYIYPKDEFIASRSRKNSNDKEISTSYVSEKTEF